MRIKNNTISKIGPLTVVWAPVLALVVLLPIAAGQALGQDYTAVVASVDYPEGCLRIRSGPGTSAPIIGCAELGSRLRLTGVWSGKWAEISRPVPGWVYGPQLDMESGPPLAAGPVVITPPAVEYIPYTVFGYPYRFHTYWSNPRRHRVFRHFRRPHRQHRRAHRHYRYPHRSNRHLRRSPVGGPRIFRAHNPGAHRFGRTLRSNVGASRRGGAFRMGGASRTGRAFRTGGAFHRGGGFHRGRAGHRGFGHRGGRRR